MCCKISEKDIEDYEGKRKTCTEAILASTAAKRLVVAGPGTGKSYLFQQICERANGASDCRIIALSFINELIDDLSRDLDGLADVKTLHSFALSSVPGEKNMFFKLGDVIRRDRALIVGDAVDYDELLCNLADAKEELEFYSKRRKYYNYFSPHCSVYTVIKYFEAHEDRIPQYTCILVDEYQDFNKLESRLLELLASRSHVVVVGDDDQSLYSFKHADPAAIRSKYASGEYQAFDLPYCSRCTRVIIDAYGEIVLAAQASGFLKERVPKKFLYFPTEKKDEISRDNPHIVLKRNVFQSAIAYNIRKDIQAAFDPRADRLPTVLVICPLARQIESVERGLRAQGFKIIDASQKYEEDIVMEGYGLLLEDSKCNLAWRLLFEAECERVGAEERFAQVVKESNETGAPFLELLTVDERRPIKKACATLRKIREGKLVERERVNEVLSALQRDPVEIATEGVRKDLVQKRAKRNIYKNTPIKIVTIRGSKGLTYDYAFLVHFDDRFLLERKSGGAYEVTDESICSFLVSLTRARRRISIYSAKSERPTYIKWLSGTLVDDQTDS